MPEREVAWMGDLAQVTMGHVVVNLSLNNKDKFITTLICIGNWEFVGWPPIVLQIGFN